MTKLLYIISLGHSGSTLLDILTGTIPGVFSTGECVWFPWQLHRDGGVCELGQDICSCGKKFSECETWVKVVTTLSQKVGYNVYDDPFHFKITMFHSQRYNGKSTFSEKLLRASCIRFMQFYYPFFLSKFFSHLVREEVINSWLLFDTISETIGSKCIVDSSKSITRMKFLHKERPNDVFVAVLIRDILGVAASAAKRGEDPINQAKAWVDYYKRAFRILKKTRNLKFIIVEYEKLAKNPLEIRNKLAKFLELDELQGPVRINTREHHLVAGNPMRYKGLTSIRYDDSWKNIITGDYKDKINKLKVDFVSKLRVLEK